MAGSGTDTINFSGTGTITLLSALPDISTSMHINGPGADQLEVRGSQTGLGFRVFNVTSAATDVIISGLTVNNGGATVGGGGGVNNAGTLTLQDCAIGNASATSGNLAASSGGGISNSGTMTVERCTVSNNVASIARRRRHL